MSMDASVWLVRAALEEAAGERASDLMRRPSKHLANQTPLEVARQPGGARIVLAELDKIVMREPKPTRQ
jgi:uncharacterized protein (DUF2384 family)